MFKSESLSGFPGVRLLYENKKMPLLINRAKQNKLGEAVRGV